jgi:hypothetical protein
VTERGLGYREDRPDTRDQLLSAGRVAPVEGALPSEYTLKSFAPPVLDQDGMQACVGYSIATALYTRQAVGGVQPTLPSPGFTWWASRKTHGDEAANEGTYIREAIKSLKALGACPDASWPMSDIEWTFAQQPSDQAFRDAYDARFAVSYERLNGWDADLKAQVMSCISAGRPVVFGITVPKRFAGHLGTHKAFTYLATDIAAGGHAMCILGYDQLGVFGPNSWGAGWGNTGWFHISWDWFLDSSRDKWALIDVARIEA